MMSIYRGWPKTKRKKKKRKKLSKTTQQITKDLGLRLCPMSNQSKFILEGFLPMTKRY
jgi:hypothetical protein